MKTLLGFLLWLMLRTYTIVARKPSYTFRTPPEQGRKAYLTRWPLWTKDPWPDADGRTAGVGWYLHKVSRSDHERELHNHPAPGCALVLRGGYCEKRREGVRGTAQWLQYGPLSFHMLQHDTFHRITLWFKDWRMHTERTSWSLFYFGPRHGRGWGFLQGNGTVRRAAHDNAHTGTKTDRTGTVDP